MHNERQHQLAEHAPLVPVPRGLPSTIPSGWRLGAVAAVLVLLVPAQSNAQELGTLTGIVITADGRPVANAQVRMVGAEAVVLTGVDGRFLLVNLSPGVQTLDVRMLGYTQVLLPVEIESGLTRSVKVALLVEPVALPAVEITEESSLSPGLRSFYERRSRGGGHFFTHEQIAKMHPRVVTDVLRRVPGVQIQAVAGPYETTYLVRMGRATGGLGARPCPCLFYINGAPFPLTADLAINQFIAPDDIEAIEVYTGTSRIPSQFSSNMHNARCGVVVIWTRIGTHGRKSPKQSAAAPSKP
jgi:hypothetical protein